MTGSEIIYGFFLCTSLEAAVAVGADVPTMVYRASPLVDDCEWLIGPHNQELVTIQPQQSMQIDNVWYDVSFVKTASGLTGYTVGEQYSF